MEFSRCILFLILSAVIVNGDPLVPGLCIFGGSAVDAGNNNNLVTLIKANFPPYGRDFPNHTATGRFCNGKLATDFTAEHLWLESYPPAYLSQVVEGANLSTGANFASAASGYFDGTSLLLGALSLPQQLSYYKDWQSKVTKAEGQGRAKTIFSKTIHLLSTGSSDFIRNYYINPLINLLYTPEQFSDVLLGSYSTFIQSLYDLGARRIGVTSLPPTGCLPAAITLFGWGSNQCVSRLNDDAVMFNNKLNATSRDLKNKLPGLKLVVFDIYYPLLNLISNPSDSGFFESRRACCGTGTVETAYLCNAISIGTCSNATEYVFWDGYHLSESANKKLAESLLEQGYDLIS